jgi:hypothetical protein
MPNNNRNDGRGQVKNPETDGRLKENGGGDDRSNRGGSGGGGSRGGSR